VFVNKVLVQLSKRGFCSPFFFLGVTVENDVPR